MRDINLLPQKQKQKHLALSVITYITFGFLILLVSIAGFAVTLTTIRVTINDKINSYISKREGIEVKIKTYKQIESEVTTTNQVLDRAVKILDQQMLPVSIIKTISDRVSDKITLSSIALSTATNPVVAKTGPTDTKFQIVIIGSAKQRSDVIDFKRGLESAGGFDDVAYIIGTTAAAGTTATSGSTDSIAFTINTKVKAAEQP